MMKLGKALRLLRKHVGVRQADIGKAVGLSTASVSQWENDEVVSYTCDVLHAYSIFFKKPISELFRIAEDIEKDPRNYMLHEPKAEYFDGVDDRADLAEIMMMLRAMPETQTTALLQLLKAWETPIPGRARKSD